MEFSRGHKLKMAIDKYCKENNIKEEEAKQLFIKEYLIEGEQITEEDPNKSFHDWLHKKDKNTVEVDVDEIVKEREEEAKISKKAWNDRAYKKQS